MFGWKKKPEPKPDKPKVGSYKISIQQLGSGTWRARLYYYDGSGVWRHATGGDIWPFTGDTRAEVVQAADKEATKRIQYRLNLTPIHHEEIDVTEDSVKARLALRPGPNPDE